MASIEKSLFKKAFFTKAKIEKLAPVVVKWEGGYVNDPADKGGPTNMGVTLNTWKHVGYDKDNDGDIDAADIKLLRKEDFKSVLKIYWNKWQADNINNQSIANILVDWYWASGKWGIVIPQRIMGLSQDGIVGPKTIARVNELIQKDAESFFYEIYNSREVFFENIVKNNPTQKKFLKGWKNRLADFKF
jgi:lysozyme family protein